MRPYLTHLQLGTQLSAATPEGAGPTALCPPCAFLMERLAGGTAGLGGRQGRAG